MVEEQDFSKDLLEQLDHTITEFNGIMNSLFSSDLDTVKANGDCEKMQNIVNLASSNTSEDAPFIQQIIHV